MCWGAVVLVVEDEGAVGVERGDEVDVVVCGLVVVVGALGAEGWAVVVVVGRLCEVVVVVGAGLVVVVGWRDTVEVVAAEAEPIVRASALHGVRRAAATISAAAQRTRRHAPPCSGTSQPEPSSPDTHRPRPFCRLRQPPKRLMVPRAQAGRSWPWATYEALAN